MTNNPDVKNKVSAIVSIYNAQKFIKGCLEDLVNQSLYKKGKLEIVIINSGSQENEEKIVNEYLPKHENIKYIKTKEREGIYTAWNRAVKISTGEYITNANADDRHHPDALEKLAAELDSDKNIDLVYSDFYVTDIPNQQFINAKNINEAQRPDFSPEIMFKGCYMGPQPMWRKAVHDKAGYFNEAFVSGGDYEFWCRLVFRFGAKFKHFSEKLGLYYRNENGIELRN